MNTLPIDNIFKMYNDGYLDEAAQEGQSFLEGNVDLDVWQQFITGLIEHGARKLYVGIADRCIEGPCYEYEFHRLMAKGLMRMKEWNRGDAWRDKYRQEQSDKIIQLYQDENVDGAVAAANHLFDSAQMGAEMTLKILGAINEAKADPLLIRIGNECLKKGKYDGDTYEFMAFEFQAIGELELAIQWMEAHIGGDYVDFTRETSTLLEMLFENGDVAKAEQVMQELNMNLTNQEYIDQGESDEYGVAELYGLFAKLGAHTRPVEKTRAIFEQAIDYTQLGDGSGSGLHEANRMYVDWLDSIGDKVRAQEIRNQMVSHADRQKQASQIIDRWLIHIWESSELNAQAQTQEAWAQFRQLKPQEHLVIRFLFAIARWETTTELVACCNDLRRMSIEEDCSSPEVAAWMIAVLFPGDLGALECIEEFTSISDPDYAERWARCLEYFLAEDYQGAAEAAGQLLASYNEAADSRRVSQCRQLIAYCELTHGQHAEAAKIYQHLIHDAEAKDTDLNLEVYSDAAKAFTATHMNEAAAEAVAKVNAIFKTSREPP